MTSLRVKYLLLEALVFLIICPLLFFSEITMGGRDNMSGQAVVLSIGSAILFAFDWISAGVHAHVLRRSNGKVLGFYLGSKLIKLFIAIVSLLICALFSEMNVLATALNVFVLYLVSLICSTVCYASVEQAVKKQKGNTL